MFSSYRHAKKRLAYDFGQQAENIALTYLERHHLTCIARNYRKKGGEIDLIMQTPENILVFVEVKARSTSHYHNAIYSISPTKQQRLLQTAQHFLIEHCYTCDCRFDVILLLKEKLHWIKDAFQSNSL